MSRYLMFREFGFLVVFLVGLVVPFLTASSRAANESYKIADGFAVYLGVLPAAMIQGHSADHPETAMHGGIPRGRHIYHIMVALFDAKSGDRIKDAGVEAQISPPGLAGTTRRLEPMAIVGTITYGNYFRLDSDGPIAFGWRSRREEHASPYPWSSPMSTTFNEKSGDARRIS